MNLEDLLIQKNNDLKNYIESEKIEAYRLLNSDSDFPFSIDFYLDKVLIYLYEDISDDLENELKYILEKKFSISKKNIIWKNRKKQKSGTQYEKIDSSRESFVILENGYKLWINLQDYLDTGIFLDHRKSRKLLKEEFAPKSKKVLNLFSYTSSFSIACSKGGSEFTTSVDMSNTYCNWTEENFILNNMNLKKNNIIRENILDLYKFMNEDRRFDLIIIDPPTFSRSKKMNIPFDIQKDYIYLINESLKKLSKSGVIFFSTNFRKFKFSTDRLDSKNFKEITDLTIPDDFKDSKIHKTFLIFKD